MIKTAFKPFIAPAAILVLFAVLAPYFLTPKINQIFVLKNEIEKQQERISLLSAKLDDLKFISETELSSSSQLLLAALPSVKDFYQQLSVLQKIFSEEGLTLDSFQFNPGSVSTRSANLENTDEKTPIKLTINGDGEKIANVIGKIEKSLPLMIIDSLEIDSSGQASFSGLLAPFTGTMIVSGFFSPLPKVLGKTDSPLPKMNDQKKTVTEKLKSYYRYSFEEMPSSGEIVVGKENPFQ